MNINTIVYKLKTILTQNHHAIHLDMELMNLLGECELTLFYSLEDFATHTLVVYDIVLNDCFNLYMLYNSNLHAKRLYSTDELVCTVYTCAGIRGSYKIYYNLCDKRIYLHVVHTSEITRDSLCELLQ